jgi:GNAT superfamily N-acetyltransferase
MNEKIEGLRIRKMGRKEVEFAVEMSASEGWNPGIHDGELFYEADPKSFFTAEIAERQIGCASAVAYDETFGFFGLYVVKPEFRRKGIGMKLTKECLKYLGERNIGLDGVVENEKNINKL